MRIAHLVGMILVGSMLLTTLPPVQAQSPSGDCSISIEPTTVSIDVSPGSASTGNTQVTVSNPTQYTEKIDLGYETAGLGHSGPPDVTLEPFGETVLTLTIQAQERMDYQTLSGSLTCVVTEINGVPNPEQNQEEKQADFIIQIKQFADLRLTSTISSITVNAGEDFTLDFTIYNDGNFRDNFLFEILRLESLRQDGFSLTLSVLSLEVEDGSSQLFSVEVRAPSSGGSFRLELEAVSEFSQEFESPSNPEADSAAVNIEVNEPPSDDTDEKTISSDTPGFGALLSLAAVSLALILIGLIKRS